MDNNEKRVSSPEGLGEYIRVAAPGVWLILGAVVILLAGFIVWCVFGTVETSVKGVLICEDGEGKIYLPPESESLPEVGMTVIANEKSGAITATESIPVEVDGVTKAYLVHVGSFESTDYCFVSDVKIDGLESGIYSAKIITDSVRPIFFIMR